MKSFLLFLSLFIVINAQVNIGCLVFTSTRQNDLQKAYDSTNVIGLCEFVTIIVDLDLLVGSKLSASGTAILTAFGGKSSKTFEFTGLKSVSIDGFSLDSSAEPMLFNGVDAIKIKDSSFHNGNKGAIFVVNSPLATVQISSSNFTLNGGLTIDVNSASLLEVQDSRFDGNQGRAIASSAQETHVINSLFVDNNALLGEETLLTNNNTKELRMENCTFEGNNQNETFVVCLSEICPNITGVSIQTTQKGQQTSNFSPLAPTKPEKSDQPENTQTGGGGIIFSGITPSTLYTYGDDSSLVPTQHQKSEATALSVSIGAVAFLLATLF